MPARFSCPSWSRVAPAPQPIQTPSTPTTPVAPPPQTYACTPEEGGPSHDCTEAEYKAQLERDKLYEEAKQVLNAYNKESDKLARDGSPASEELLSYTAGPFTDVVREEYSHGFSYVGGESKTVWVKRLVGEELLDGSTLALQTCTDTTSVTIMQGNKEVGSGRFSEVWMFFRETADGMEIVAASHLEVEKC